jgi:hypothetical protein
VLGKRYGLSYRDQKLGTTAYVMIRCLELNPNYLESYPSLKFPDARMTGVIEANHIVGA